MPPIDPAPNRLFGALQSPSAVSTAAVSSTHPSLARSLAVGGIPLDATEAEIISRFSKLPGLAVVAVRPIRDALSNGAEGRWRPH
jgi:hypothetical protein